MEPTAEVYDQHLQMAMQSRDYPRAKAVALAIIATRPGELRPLIALADISLFQGLWDEAAAYCDRALGAAPGNVYAVLLSARIAYARGDAGAAIARCDEALALKPGDEDALMLKATALERKGDWQGAIATLAPLTAQGGGSPPVVQVVAKCLMRGGDHRAAVAAIDGSLDSFLSLDAATRQTRSRLLFLKAKALDSLGEYDGAFAAAVQAKRLASKPFDAEAFVQEHSRLIETCSRERLAALPRADATAARHIFIAGIPRSGTTLVEQIVDAHPEAVGVGEMKELSIFAARLPEMLGSKRPYPDCMDELTAEHVNSMRTEYERAIARHGFPTAPVYINKSLDNPMHLGLIALLFPEARIIVTRRDPRDIAVSCLMSAFRAEKHPALSTVAHTFLAHRQWERLVEHFKGALDLPFHEVQYEELVRDQDRLSRRLIDFCGLPWDDRCASFHQSGRTVMTLSYDQVNRPMYDSSIGRWKNYEKHLANIAV